MALLKVAGFVLLHLSISYGFEICHKKESLFGDSTLLTCSDKCCGLTDLTKYCCTPTLDDIGDKIKDVGDSISDTINGRSDTTVTVGDVRLDTATIIGISVGSLIGIVILVVFFNWCCRRLSATPGHVITSGRPMVTVVSSGQSAYPGPTGVGYLPAQGVVSPPVYTPPSKLN